MVYCVAIVLCDILNSCAWIKATGTGPELKGMCHLKGASTFLMLLLLNRACWSILFSYIYFRYFIWSIGETLITIEKGGGGQIKKRQQLNCGPCYLKKELWFEIELNAPSHSEIFIINSHKFMPKKDVLSNCSKIQTKWHTAELQRCGGISIFTSHLRSWYSYPWEHAECVLLIRAWCCQEIDELFITSLYFCVPL